MGSASNLQPPAPPLRPTHSTASVPTVYFPNVATNPLSMLSSITGPAGSDNLLSLPVSNLNAAISSTSSGLQMLGNTGQASASGSDKNSTLFRNMMPSNPSYLQGPQSSEHSLPHNSSTSGNLHNATPNSGMNSAAHAGMQPYSSLLGNNPSSILNNGLNPLAPAVNNMSPNNSLSLNGVMPPGNTLSQANVIQHQGQSPHQPAYFVQQAVYVDANGQPIYYRTGIKKFIDVTLNIDNAIS